MSDAGRRRAVRGVSRSSPEPVRWTARAVRVRRHNPRALIGWSERPRTTVGHARFGPPGIAVDWNVAVSTPFDQVGVWEALFGRRHADGVVRVAPRSDEIATARPRVERRRREPTDAPALRHGERGSEAFVCSLATPIRRVERGFGPRDCR